MSLDTDDLQLRLHELAEEPAPADLVDIAGAIRVGRRRLVRRRLARTAGVGVLACAVGLGVFVLPGGGTEVSAAKGGTSSGTLSGPDPLVAPYGFGWLPAEFNSIGVGMVDSAQKGTESQPEAIALLRGNDAVNISYYRLDKGEQPDLTGFANGKIVNGTEVATTPINGMPAFWVELPGMPQRQQLYWKLPDGQLAGLDGENLPGQVADPAVTLRRIAADMREGDHLVPLPLRISGLPKEFSLRNVTLTTNLNGNRSWTEMAQYATPSGVVFNIWATAGTGWEGGTPGAATVTTKGVLVSVFKQNQADAASLDAIGGLKGVLNHVVVLGNDSANWTTEAFLPQ